MADLSAQQLRKLQVMGVRVWQDRARRPVVSAATEQSGQSSVRPPTDGSAAIGTSTPSAPTQQPTTPQQQAAQSTSPPPDVSAYDWQMLRAAVSSCTLCALSNTRSKTVFGIGAEHADLMIIGEAPGAEEDRRGEPFVGRAGQLLDGMLASIGYSRKSVFIANVLKCRPPANRDPHTEEASACSGYLDRQIELVKPKAILAVGRIAAQRLLDSSASLARMRGKVHYYGMNKTPLVITYHPAYLLRSPQQKRKAWEDLMSAHALLQDTTNAAPAS